MSHRNTKLNQRGFSLIELMIVVAIILIIAAIAIPSLLRAKIVANEASAAESVRQIAVGQLGYNQTYGTYAPTLTALGPGAGNANCAASGPTSAASCLLDSVLASGSKSGYTFASAGDNQVNGVFSGYLTTAIPISAGSSGNRGFCAVEDNNVKVVPGPVAAISQSTCQTANSVSQ